MVFGLQMPNPKSQILKFQIPQLLRFEIWNWGFEIYPSSTLAGHCVLVCGIRPAGARSVGLKSRFVPQNHLDKMIFQLGPPDIQPADRPAVLGEPLEKFLAPVPILVRADV